MINAALKLTAVRLAALACCAGVLLHSGAALAGPELQMPDGTKVEAASLPYFQDRPKVVGFLQKIIDRKLGGDMALAVSPPFCPSYSYTSWGGEDPVGRASQKCQARIDKLMSDAELPAAARLGCKCSLAVRNMTVLDADALMRATRFTNVKLFIKPPGAPVQTRAGILEYEKNDLVKQDFALFNAGKTKICSGQLEFKIGDLGKFFGTCFGKQPIRDGGVMIGCPSDVFCSRHSVGNMRMDDGTFIGFVSVLKSAEIAKTYPGLPEKLDAAPAAQAPQEEEIND